MDIQKSQRLSQYLGVVSDMVAYEDIKDSMVHARVISEAERAHLERKLQAEGNVAAMNELLTMVNLRRGGYDALLGALRQSDYLWLAEQLDPGKSLTGLTIASTATDNNGARNSSLQNFVKRISRKSEPAIAIGASHDDIIYTTYRDSCPIDIPINPSFYANLNQPQEPEITDPCNSQDDKHTLGMLKSLTLKSSLKKEVIIHNFDPGHTECNNFENLVKLARVPSPLLKDLKVLNKGKISKKKIKKEKKIKLSFASETARKEFVDHMHNFIANLEPSEETYTSMKNVKVSIPGKGRIERRDNPGKSSAKSSSFGSGVMKQRWYKKSFRLHSTKKTS